MRGNIFVNQTADHLLIFQAMFVGLGLKKIMVEEFFDDEDYDENDKPLY